MARRGKSLGEKTTDAWRKHALRHPGTVEGGVCVNAAFKAGGKSFFFMGMKSGGYDARLKLTDSLEEASRLAAAEPDHYAVGLHGWVHVTFPPDAAPPAGLVERWMEESFRKLAPRKLVAELPEGGLAKSAKASRSRR